MFINVNLHFVDDYEGVYNAIVNDLPDSVENER